MSASEPNAPTPSDLIARDREVIWHPATHFGDLERVPPIPVRSARGAWLETEDGRRILDGVSSWWTSIHGHGHPAIVAAIHEQVARLDHVMFAGFTHEPAVALAERLLALAPGDYGKVFYSDCGSASIEVALKMSYQSRVLRGQPERRRFATLQRSYHGETLGALAVCGSADWRQPFGPLLMDALTLPSPVLPDHTDADLANDASADAPETEAALELLEAHAHELSAVLVEPIVQCAGRMTMPGAGFYRRLVERAQALDIHVIADEIAVGFGRTGRLFASEHAGVSPDLLCLSKGLSGGVLPLAATLVRRGFEDLFRGGPERSFLHSHTFTGNPVTCAAGLASLELFESEGRLAQLPGRAEAIERRRLRVAERCPAVVASRQAGLIAALEVSTGPERPGPADGRLGLALREAALERGVLLRPLHDTIYWMPPLNVTDDELDRLAEVTAECIEAVLG